MTLSPEVLTVVAIAAAALAVVGLLLAWRARRDHAALLHRFEVLWGDDPGDVASVLDRQSAALGTERTRIDGLERTVAGLRDEVSQSLQHVAVVRYDAFGDMGGRLSFSAAVIDDRGDGMVLSSIHARGESRTYAKGIVGGRSDVTLTPEEQQALAAAREGEDA
ncbi:DUF4446 family protein [Ornithinicoccus hortensis]|uniref:Uncharacterized protein DUF4446 n=1 Tax=Ornithinicoccus hortensis TaxID=82346 RepID=A0A542YNP1_9MICO|nr:DUF4446 family protein [Ornithinicoccus hortensis]TQL49544.1 uncharacterized protein DUF4446 [Ornithinicoccus hortensis]